MVIRSVESIVRRRRRGALITEVVVAMGLLTQLVVERWEAEAQQVAAFFAQVGLPIH